MSSLLNNKRKPLRPAKVVRAMSKFVCLEAGCSDGSADESDGGDSVSSFLTQGSEGGDDPNFHRRLNQDLTKFKPMLKPKSIGAKELLAMQERMFQFAPSQAQDLCESDDDDDGDTSRHHRHQSPESPTQVQPSQSQKPRSPVTKWLEEYAREHPAKRKKSVARKCVRDSDDDLESESESESRRESESESESCRESSQDFDDGDDEPAVAVPLPGEPGGGMFPQDVHYEGGKYDSKSRVGSFCFVVFPYDKDDAAGKGVLGRDGVWGPTAAHLALCMSGDKTIMIPSMERVKRHPTAQICRMGGQWEYAPSTGTLHFQGYIQCMSKPTKKNPESKQFKAVAATMAARLRECHDDDCAMTSVDGFKLADVPFRFNLSPGIDVRKMIRYSTRETNPDGSVKRAFGDAVSWALNESMTDEVRVGPALGQLTSMLLGGSSTLDALVRFPAQGMQYYRNMKEIAQEVKSRSNEAGTLRRCLNPFCGLPQCDETTARSRADMLGMTYNEYVLKANTPCDVAATYCYGEAGTGKSSFSYSVACMENAGDVYIKPADAYWGSNSGKKYEGEKALVIHDVAAGHFATGGGKPFDNFKNVVDCTHLSVPTKGGTVPCYVNKFYFDGNVDPCSFFLDMIGDGKHDNVYSAEYPAFRRRIGKLFYYSMSADRAVTIVGQTMPALQSFLKTLSLRRRWTASKDSSPIPTFEYGVAPAPAAGVTHGTLSARASDAMFMTRFANQIRR